MLSRIQFAVTSMFHILWPVVTIGMSLFLVFLEAMWLRTQDSGYYRQARFWSKLFFLNVAIGVVTGIPLEFQFGTNWSVFSAAGGDFLGHILGFEGAMAFMLEASFLGVMMLGWNRVSPKMHLFSTAMVALGASISAFWIMVANSWMQFPAGGHLENGRFIVTDEAAAIFSPTMFWAATHMWVACLEITVFVVGGISAWHLLKRRHTDFYLKAFRMAAAAAFVIAPLQVYVGDGSGVSVHRHQPVKLAAMEAHWETNPPGRGATWNIAAWADEGKRENTWAVGIPYVLSLITTHRPTGEIKGLREFPPEYQPPVNLIFYSFRIMVIAGFAFVGLILWTGWAWRRKKLKPDLISSQRWLLTAWMAALPLSYLAMETGWITREVGRQPWILYGMLKTGETASLLPKAAVAGSLLAVSAIYAVIFSVFLYLAKRILTKGPATVEPPQ